MSDKKWASISDLAPVVKEETIVKALEASWCYVFDATNWEIKLSSSTSGMYGSWYVGICPTTTVRDLRKTPPRGTGGSLEEAFINFTERMEQFNKENGFAR